MNRKEFLKLCGLLGIGIPIMNTCRSSIKGSPLKSSDKVIIIGAGAAGLSAAYLLNQQGVQVEILEASSTYGGRMKRTKTFADFPIPTGAEWLHTKKSVLNDIVNDKSVELNITTTPYNFDVDYALIDGKKESLKKLGFSIDQKFINATWFDFYEQYIVPSISNKIRFNSIVQSIDYSSDKIQIKTGDGIFSADRIIITVPVKILQNGSIEFTPALPKKRLDAIRNTIVWGGCKVFLEFSEKFYPTAVGFESIPEDQGHKLFYDAAYGQKTAQHILGIFAVGPVSKPYLDKQGDELKSFLLEELDQLFAGKASSSYKRHIFQNWTAEPFAQGAYVHYFESWKNIMELGKPIANKLYFAGDAYTDGSEWSSVHAAAKSAKRVVEQLIAN